MTTHKAACSTDITAGLLDELLDAINDCPDPAPGVWERFGQVVGYSKELRQFLATEAGAARFNTFIRDYRLAYVIDGPDQALQVAHEFTAEVQHFAEATSHE